ncbi:FAD-binding oxidoreductase, partial [Nodosilinea sp. LEGE 07298]|nr:FAD-binding oxidoreductase [Nodosilinea sp. LEGE 07298]
MTLTQHMLSGLPGNPLVGLEKADDLWRRYRTGDLPQQQVVHQATTPLESVEWDVVICGGTLGVLVGAGLA